MYFLIYISILSFSQSVILSSLSESTILSFSHSFILSFVHYSIHSIGISLISSLPGCIVALYRCLILRWFVAWTLLRGLKDSFYSVASIRTQGIIANCFWWWASKVHVDSWIVSDSSWKQLKKDSKIYSPKYNTKEIWPGNMSKAGRACLARNLAHS